MTQERVSIFAAGGQQNAIDDQVNIRWFLTDLLLSYKYGEKYRFKRALDKLYPYMDDKLYQFFEQVYEDSLWLTPDGKKGK